MAPVPARDCVARQHPRVSFVTQLGVTCVTSECDVRHTSSSGSGTGPVGGCMRRSARRPRPRAPCVGRRPEELEDERLGIRVVLAHASPAEPADPHGGAPTVPAIHRSLPSDRDQCCQVLSGRRLQGCLVGTPRARPVESFAIQTERADGRPRDHARGPGNVPKQGDLAEVRARSQGPDVAAVLRTIRPARIGSRRTRPRPPPARPASRPAWPSPTIRARAATASSSCRAPRRRACPAAPPSSAASAELRRVDRARQQPVERALVDREHLGVLRSRERSRSSVRIRAARSPRTIRPFAAS